MNFKDTDDPNHIHGAQHFKPRVELITKSLKQNNWSLGYISGQSKKAMGESVKRKVMYFGSTKQNISISFETARHKTIVIQFIAVDVYLQDNPKASKLREVINIIDV